MEKVPCSSQDIVPPLSQDNANEEQGRHYDDNLPARTNVHEPSFMKPSKSTEVQFSEVEQLCMVSQKKRKRRRQHNSKRDLEGENDDENEPRDKLEKFAAKRKKEGLKWHFLQHKGPLFPPEYQPLPEGVRFFYDGNEMKLSPETEEVATIFSRVMDKRCASKSTFKENFFNDWFAVMTDEEKSVIKDLGKCNFDEIRKYYNAQKEEHKSKANRKSLKRSKELISTEYGTCDVDGRQEKVANYRLNPPRIFIGKDEDDAKNGKLQRRIKPEDVIINCSEDSRIPEPPPSHGWKSVRHDQTVRWLACWWDEVHNQVRYMELYSSSVHEASERVDPMPKLFDVGMVLGVKWTVGATLSEESLPHSVMQLAHAYNCKKLEDHHGPSACQLQECHLYQDVIHHARSCKLDKCNYTNTREIIEHWDECEEMACPFCLPLGRQQSQPDSSNTAVVSHKKPQSTTNVFRVDQQQMKPDILEKIESRDVQRSAPPLCTIVKDEKGNIIPLPLNRDSKSFPRAVGKRKNSTRKRKSKKNRELSQICKSAASISKKKGTSYEAERAKLRAERKRYMKIKGDTENKIDFDTFDNSIIERALCANCQSPQSSSAYTCVNKHPTCLTCAEVIFDVSICQECANSDKKNILKCRDPMHYKCSKCHALGMQLINLHCNETFYQHCTFKCRIVGCSCNGVMKYDAFKKHFEKIIDDKREK